MPAQQVGLIEVLRLRWSERDMLTRPRLAPAFSAEAPSHVAESAAPASSPPPGQSGASASAIGVSVSRSVAPASAASGSGASSGFVTSRTAPAPVASNLAHVSHAAAAPAVVPTNQAQASRVVRGACPGCGQSVWSDDEGRMREGDSYFHGECFKGMCGGCGEVVHADQDRSKIGGEYWHDDCIATSSQAPRGR